MSHDVSSREELFAQLLELEGLDFESAPTIPRRANYEASHLSFAQSRIWFLEQLDGPTPTYNMPATIRLDGDLDFDALRLSLRDIRNRHETLRTRFVKRGDEPVQVVDPQGDFALPLTDLTGFHLEERNTRLQRLTSENASQPFDLTQGPLLRCQLVRLEPRRHVLLFAMHHIISDGWSVAVLISELTILYRSHHNGGDPELPLLPIQYADYAEWQREHLTNESFEPHLSYWRDRLADAPEMVSLPTDRPLPPVQTFNGCTHRFQIGLDLLTRVQRLGRRHDATLFMVLQTGFAALLSRYSGSEDIVFGTPVANRNVIGLEPLIGFFSNTLVLRTDLSGDPTFGELIGRVRATLLRDLEHQELPFEVLVDKLQPRRNLSFAPLIQALLTLENTPQSNLELPGLTVEIEQPRTDVAKFQITMAMTETTAGLVGEIEYNTDLFDEATIRRMTVHFENILDVMARDSEARVSQAEFLSADEIKLLLHTLNDNATAFPRDKCIQQLFEEQAAETPGAIALVFGARHLTYAELNARGNQLAHRLRALGVGPDVSVPILCERSIDLIVGIVGILKAGGAYVPLDPRYPADRLSYMFGEVKSPVLLTQRAYAAALPGGDFTLLLLDDDWPVIARESHENLPQYTRHDNLAYVIFTSGSTGRPKGVRVVHDGVTSLVKNTNYAKMSSDEIFLQLTPIAFDVSTFDIWGCLLNGGRLVVAPPEIPSSYEIGRLIKDYGITTMWLSAGLFHLMVDENLDGLRPLRQLLAGGDALSVAHCRRVLKEIPSLRLINGYGPTECTTFTTCCTLTEEIIGNTVPIGRPVSNTRVYILDKNGKLLPPGCVGELCAGGYGLARDYLNDPALTAEKFIADPFDRTPSARLYRIGDLCRYLPDGNIEYLGRTDRQVKVRGFRIELAEIETVLSAHAAVRSCTVTAHADPSGNRRLVAYVVPADWHDVPDTETLRAALARRLPDFMVPAIFVMMEALPLNSNGKVDRNVLPAPEALPEEGTLIAPRTETEKVLQEIWSQLLDLSSPGIHDNFFAIGGHSLMAIQVVSRVRDRFGVEVPVRQIFEAPTIAGLSTYLDQRRQAGREERCLRPIHRRPKDQTPPLSFAQQRLWFLYQYDPQSAAYNVPITLRLKGRLRIDLLVRSFQEIVHRHEALRTNFVQQGDTVIQLIHQQRQLELRTEDLSLLPLGEAEATCRQLTQTESLLPFNLETDILLRLLLVRVTMDDHVLLMTMHHIVCDGWSLGILFDEFSKLYRAFAAEQASPLGPLPLHYADYATWQRTSKEGDTFHGQLNYWRARLEGAPKRLELPTDRPRPAKQTHRGHAHLFQIGSAIADGLSLLSHEAGASPFMVLLSAYAALLSRYSGQDDVVIGSPVANRKHSDVEPLIGFFVNTLPLRIDLSGDPTFRGLIARVRDTTLDAFANDDLPLERLIEDLSPERNLGHAPLFQTLFALQNARIPELVLPDLELTVVDQLSRIAKFDLTLTIEEADGSLRGEFEYNIDLFDIDMITGFSESLNLLLQEAVANPDAQLSSLQAVPEAERQRLLTDWSQGETVNEAVICVPRWFENQANLTPDLTAVALEDQSWTYRDLNERANRLARVLQDGGVCADFPVGLCFERSYEMVVAQLAVLKAGGAYVPLDPGYPQARLDFMVRDTDMKLLLTTTKLSSKFGLELVFCLDENAATIAAKSRTDLAFSPAPESLAYIIYTSGSTGQPKGVMVPHRALANHMRWMQRTFSITSSDCVLQKTPFSFDASVWEFYLPLLSGGTLALARADGHFDPDYLVEAIRAHRVTVIQGVPSLLRMLVRADGFRETRSLRYVFSGGEALTADLRDDLFEATPATICNLYGPTEACIDATFHVCSHDETSPVVPIGRPIDNAAAYILDRHGRPVPVGVTGELYLAGTPLALGYWGRPELTAERFVSNPFGSGQLYKTGDRARFRRDGNLEFLGREDDQIKLRGVRIEPGEIEAALRLHIAVNDAAVVVVDGRPDGQHLLAFVQSCDGHSMVTADVRTWLRDRIPDYMVPSAWAILDNFPRLPNGKIDKASLPVDESLRQPQGYLAPPTGVEDVLASIWSVVLNIASVDRNDNFFALGGHSLLATQMISRARDAFSVEIPLRAVFESPTVAELARVINELVRIRTSIGPLPKIEPAVRTGILPLSFAQQRLWFLQQVDAANPYYNMPMALEITGPLDLAVLQRSISEVVRRHEALRTSFTSIDGNPAQLIHEAHEISLDVVDLQRLAADIQASEVEQWARAEVSRAFDLSNDPLLRASILRLSDYRNIFLLTMHHIASDGWSMGILIDEVTRLYEAFARNEPSPLPQLSIQYADYAVWQREHLASQVRDTQMAYWQRQLTGAAPLLDLPTDRRRPAVHTFQGEQLNIRFDTEISKQLRAFSRDSGATLFMTLIAGFTAVLARYSQQDDIVVGTPVANRGRAEIEPLIGFFVNMLPLRTTLSDDPNFSVLVGRTLRTALDAYAHQDLPFEQLVEALHPDRDMSRSPLVQVSFALQNAPVPPLEVEGLRLTSLELQAKTVRFDMEVHLWDTPHGIEGYLLYYRDIFERPTMARFVRHFERLLRAVMAEPEKPISALSLLGAEEQPTPIEALNAVAGQTLPNRCLHHWFEEQAERTPDAVAVVAFLGEDGAEAGIRQTETSVGTEHDWRARGSGERTTYGELNARANQLAHCLRECGAGPDVLVGLCVGRSIDMIVGVLGILKAGAAYVPLDPDYPPDRLTFMMEDSRVAILVTESRYQAIQQPVSCQVVAIDTSASTIAAYPVCNPSCDVGPDNLAYVIYTSGSTGKPKGALITHANVSRLFTTSEPYFVFSADDVWTLFHSFAFDFSVWEIWGALLYGGRLVVVPYWVSRSPDRFRRLVSDQAVTILNQTPSAFRQLVGADASKPGRALSLRHIILGGEALDLQSLRPWFDRHGDDRPWVTNMFGITETTVHVTCRRVVKADLEREGSLIGRPLPDLRLWLLDKHLQPVPDGTPGEIFVGGPGVARGYLNRPDLEAQRFIDDPFYPGRLYRTGDLARMRIDGDLEYLGRIDDQVKIRGFRIEPGEIEAVLRKHPAIEDAVVVVREDEPGDKRQVAYLKADTCAPQHVREAVSGGHPVTEYAAHWRQVFDENYGSASDEHGVDFDIAGWNSSYTGAPIPADQMREWVDSTVERIRSLQADDILEIGCGTGLLLSRLAPGCARYRATDFSAAAVGKIGRLREDFPALAHVTIEQRSAEDFTGIEADSVQLIVLNSVAQYFPNLDYFLRVIEGAVRTIRPGGHLFLGDLRSLALLDAYHSSVQLFRAPDDLTASQLKQLIALRIAQEDELLLDPDLFFAIRERLPKIGDIRIMLKRGHYQNEMTIFRYDVVIAITGESDLEPITWTTWQDARPSLDDLTEILRRHRPRVLALKDVSNARLQAERQMGAWLGSAAEDEPVSVLRKQLQATVSEALDPEALYALAEANGYAAEVSWPAADPRGNFDLVLYQGPARPGLTRSPDPSTLRPPHVYSSNPLRRKLMQDLVPGLRRDLQKQLPAYMVPSTFVVLDEFPLTPNGKLDRRALPAPDKAIRNADTHVVLPRTRVQEILAGIWAQVLGLDSVGITDNFFELGGDSILGIQIVSRAIHAGLSLSPRQLFLHQTIEELAAVAEETGPGEQADSGDDCGDAPLTPIQHWFFEAGHTDPHHYDQAVLLEVSPSLDLATLQTAIDAVCANHPSLGLRFFQDGGVWRQSLANDGRVPEVIIEDCATRASTASRLPSSLNLVDGPVMRIAYFRGNKDEPGRLLWIIHHLLIDGVSWRILLEDLETACRQIENGGDIALLPASAPFTRWARRLQDHARSGAVLKELSFWQQVCKSRVPSIADRRSETPRQNTSANTACRSFELSSAMTGSLLHDVPPVYRTRINDILLTALVETFADLTGSRALLLDLEGHGREALFPELEVARTTGWFTTIFPVYLNLEHASSPGEAIKSIKEQLRQIPHNGIGYGLLRYLTNDPVIRTSLDQQQPEISFNYLGQLDLAVGTSRYFRPASEPIEQLISPGHRRRHLLEMDASIISGRLLINLTYLKSAFDSQMIETLGNAYLGQLRTLIEHCRSPEAGGFTPSDFAGARVGGKNLDRLLSKLGPRL